MTKGYRDILGDLEQMNDLFKKEFKNKMFQYMENYCTAAIRIRKEDLQEILNSANSYHNNTYREQASGVNPNPYFKRSTHHTAYYFNNEDEISDEKRVIRWHRKIYPAF